MRTLNVFDVSENHIVRAADTHRLQRGVMLFGLAFTGRGNDTSVAFSHSKSVTLQRLRHTSLPLRLEPLSSANLSAPSWLVFREDRLLLVGNGNTNANQNAIVLLRVSGDALTEQQTLCNAQHGDSVKAEAFAGSRLVLLDWK